MPFPSKRGLTGGVAAVAAVFFLAASGAWAADSRATFPKKPVKKAEEKRGFKLDLDVILPNDSNAPTMFGGGLLYPFGKNFDLRGEMSYGVIRTAAFMPIFLGGRYSFAKRKNLDLFGEGGLDYTTATFMTRSASVVGLGLGGGADYYFSRRLFATASVRLHTTTLTVYYNGDKVAASPQVTLLLGIGYAF